MRDLKCELWGQNLVRRVFRIHCSVSYNMNVWLMSAASNVGHFISPSPAVLLL